MRKTLIATLVLISGLFMVNAVAATYAERLCSTGKYRCIQVKNDQGWWDLFPNQNDRILAQRLNRMNTRLYDGMWLALPNHNASLMSDAPFLPQISSQGKRLIIVDPTQLAFGAYDETGKLVYWGPASAGQHYCPDTHQHCKTPTGSFNVFKKGGMHCVSSKYPLGEGGAPMPYCMFFNAGVALHGSPIVPGFNASHGCVRTFPEDAWWLSTNFALNETRVLVRPY